MLITLGVDFKTGFCLESFGGKLIKRSALFDPGEPDKELNPKKKVWEQVQPDLLTDDQCVATYKGVAFEVTGKGVCKAQTMSKSGIK